MNKKTNLANELRPNKIEDIIGQSHLLEKDGIIDRMIQCHMLFSLILYGPPGIGKSSLAICLANSLKVPYAVFNATIDDKEKLLSIIKTAKMSQEYIVIIEEIHRLNRDKQDILLPLIEHNNLTVFITTTENPFFVINPALRSRCQILQLKTISPEEMFEGLKKLIDSQKIPLKIADKYIKEIVNYTNGDFRATLNLFDLLINLYPDYEINEDLLKKILTQSYILGSADGDEIHDVKSAFHKSIRGSDPNAAIYYLMRLIQIGDMEAIYRRMLAMVYEDIGLANPNLALRVKTAIDVSRYLGLPEAKYALADAVLEMALSPKSDTVTLSIQKADKDVLNGKLYDIPIYLKDAHYKSAEKLGIKGYKYPHDYPGHYVQEDYLPVELRNKIYYSPNLDNSNEQKINEIYVKFIKNALEKQNKG